MTDDVERLLQELEDRHFGKYRGTVVDADDPLSQGRVQVQVPAVLGEQHLWAMPCSPYAGPDVGFFALPPVGANVWVEFEGGQRNHPIWAGGFWGPGQLPATDTGADVVWLRTPGAAIRIEASGTVEIETVHGARLVIDGSEITLDAPAIKHRANGATTELSAGGFDAMNGALKIF